MTSRTLRLLAACTAALALAGVAGAATTPTATRWAVTQYGFSLILPTTWYPIPRNVAAIKQTIANYKAQHNTSLAGAYTEVLKSPQEISLLSKYVFQAFLWPPLKSVVPTQVSVQVTSGHFTTADLAAAGAEYASALSGSDTTEPAPMRVTLAAGPAELVQADIGNGTGVQTGAALYILAHAGKLYVVGFQIDGTLLHETAYSNALREIANTFSFKV